MPLPLFNGGKTPPKLGLDRKISQMMSQELQCLWARYWNKYIHIFKEIRKK